MLQRKKGSLWTQKKTPSFNKGIAIEFLWLEKKILMPYRIHYWWEAKLIYKFLGPPAFCFPETLKYLGNAEKEEIFSLSVQENQGAVRHREWCVT